MTFVGVSVSAPFLAPVLVAPSVSVPVPVPVSVSVLFQVLVGVTSSASNEFLPPLRATRAVTWLTVYRPPQVLRTGVPAENQFRGYVVLGSSILHFWLCCEHYFCEHDVNAAMVGYSPPFVCGPVSGYRL